MADKKHLIYKEDLLDLFTVQAPSMSYNKMFTSVANAPTVDAVEVVRCNECQHTRSKTKNEKALYNEDICICVCPDVFGEQKNELVWSDHYCSYGERRTDGK